MRPGGRGRIVDDDGTVADVIVADVRPGERVAWHWSSDGGELSSVELHIDELDGHTRLRIVETTLFPVGPPPPPCPPGSADAVPHRVRVHTPVVGRRLAALAPRRPAAFV